MKRYFSHLMVYLDITEKNQNWFHSIVYVGFIFIVFHSNTAGILVVRSQGLFYLSHNSHKRETDPT